MSPDTEALFGTVAQRDYLGLIDQGEPRCEKVADLLKFKGRDVAHAIGVPVSSVRFEANKIPPEMVERLREWAQALNLVAHFFKGDVEKTALWFTIPNPLLGGVTPRDMIRIGRFHKLYQFIKVALAENIPASDGVP
jgi:hypothetical protein